MKGIIYVAENLINGKTYVGQTIQKWPLRKNGHIGNPDKYSAIDRALKKYGSENFKWDIIDRTDDQNTLNMLERLQISRYESMTTHWGYNICEGGSNGKPSKETIKKLSISKSGSKNPFYGRIHSKRSKGKISKSKLGKYPGATFAKSRHPESKCWKAQIIINGHHKSLGVFHDPISASIVSQLVFNELYGDVECQ